MLFRSPLTAAIGDQRSIDGVTLYPVGHLRRDVRLGFVAYLQRDLTFLARAALEAFRLHRHRRYDVVQVHTMPDYLVFAALFPKLMGAKVLLDVHDLVPELYASKFGGKESSLIVRMTRFAERRSIAFADHALAVHEPHLDVLVGHGNPRGKFTIVMNVPDQARFRRLPERSTPPAAFTLIYHGTVSSRHGLASAVRALVLARRSHDDIRLEVVGDGDGIGELRSLVEQLELAEAVTVTEGRFPPEELQPLFERASAGIVPITDDVFARFMLPTKLLEYVALGLPVISSRTQTIQAYFDDTMVSFVEPGDEADLSEKILELRRDAERRVQLVAAADAFLAQHSWSRERERYFAVIDSLVGAGESKPGREGHRRRHGERGRRRRSAGEASVRELGDRGSS